MAQNSADRFHVHVIDRIVPVCFLLLWDDEVYFEPYLSQEKGRTCPTFVLKRNETNLGVFAAFEEYTKTLLEAAAERTEFGPDLRVMWTSWGHGESRQALRQAIFLDRDGVIVVDKNYISRPEQIELIPGIIDFLREFQLSYRLVVVTNQSGVARGYFTEEDLTVINNRLLELLSEHGTGLDAILYCPHHPSEGLDEYRLECDCRKPKPRLLLQAAEHFKLDMNQCVVIGDKESDIEAGHNVKCKTIRISSDVADGEDVSAADEVVPNIAAAGAALRKLFD